MSDIVGAVVALVAALSGADLFGLVAALVVCAYLFYALLRGEDL
jgi:hypothetical protein